MRFAAWFYNLLYRINAAPWDKEVRPVLVELVDNGRLDPAALASAIDLGCGTGAEAVFLASHGFSRVVGVDFSPVAVRRATQRAAADGVSDRCEFVRADLSSGQVPGLSGQFDLVCDFGALNDLQGEARRAVAALIGQLCRPGGTVLVWAFQADKSQLPRPARMTPMLAPGEEKELFSEAFEIEYLPSRPRSVTLLMTRRST